MTYKEEFITFMVRSGVLTFGDFTTKSRTEDPLISSTPGTTRPGPRRPSWETTTPPAFRSICRRESPACSAPPYKGIPLAVSAAASLYRNYDRDLPLLLQTGKEAKDHGEGGSMGGLQATGRR